MRTGRVGVLWVTLSAVAYSFFTVFTRGARNDGLRPTDILVWRFVLAVPVAWAVVAVRARRGGPRPTAAPIGRMLMLGVLFGGLALCGFTALSDIPGGLYVIIVYTYPAMVAVASWLLGQPAPKALWVALAVTTTGIGLTTIPGMLGDDSPVGAVGLIFSVLNAILYAGYVLLSGRLMGRRPRHGHVTEAPAPPRYDGIVSSAWSLTGSLAMALAIAAVQGARTPSRAGVFLDLGGLAVVSTVVGGMALMVGMVSLTPPTAATIATLEPILTIVWAITLLGERLSALQLLGAAFVVVGVTQAQRAATGRARSEPTAGRSTPSPTLTG